MKAEMYEPMRHDKTMRWNVEMMKAGQGVSELLLSSVPSRLKSAEDAPRCPAGLVLLETSLAMDSTALWGIKKI